MTSPEERDRRSRRRKRNMVAKELRENRQYLPKVVKSQDKRERKLTIKDIEINDDI
jgi:hypothetical protein